MLCLACTCRYWDFGVVPVVKDMFQDPNFREHYQQPRRYDDPSSYHASQAFKDYDRAANYRCGQARGEGIPATCMFQIGGDGVSLLNFGQRTATVIGIRCEELPGEASQSNMAWRPIIIVEGPKETTNLKHILRDTVTQLCMHAPMGSDGKSICGWGCLVHSCSTTSLATAPPSLTHGSHDCSLSTTNASHSLQR